MKKVVITQICCYLFKNNFFSLKNLNLQQWVFGLFWTSSLYSVTCILGSLTGMWSRQSTKPGYQEYSGLAKQKKKNNKKSLLSWKNWKLVYFICYPEATGNIPHGSVWFGLCDTGWKDSLLFHPVGLRTQDETEKILIWNGWSYICRWGSTPLIVQPGALKHEVLLLRAV